MGFPCSGHSPPLGTLEPGFHPVAKGPGKGALGNCLSGPWVNTAGKGWGLLHPVLDAHNDLFRRFGDPYFEGHNQGYPGPRWVSTVKILLYSLFFLRPLAHLPLILGIRGTLPREFEPGGPLEPPVWRYSLGSRHIFWPTGVHSIGGFWAFSPGLGGEFFLTPSLCLGPFCGFYPGIPLRVGGPPCIFARSASHFVGGKKGDRRPPRFYKLKGPGGAAKWGRACFFPRPRKFWGEDRLLGRKGRFFSRRRPPLYMRGAPPLLVENPPAKRWGGITKFY